jgi:hypothetical protein
MLNAQLQKVHILRITHFSETTKDRNLIFGMVGDANVKLCIQHLLSLGLSPTPLGNLYKKMLNAQLHIQG